MGIGPVDAIRKLLKCTDMSLDKIDLVEVSETKNGVATSSVCLSTLYQCTLDKILTKE